MKLETFEDKEVQNAEEGRISGETSNSPVSGEFPVSKNKVLVAVENVPEEDREVFSSRDTVATEELMEKALNDNSRQAVAVRAAKLLESSKDERLHSDNLDRAFRTLDEHTVDIQKEVDLHILEDRRSREHFELTRRSRGVFTKLADFGSNIWSGATPEERAAGKKGIGGIRGFLMSDEQRQEEFMRNAGIDPKELKSIPEPQLEPEPVKTHPSEPLAKEYLLPSLIDEIKDEIKGAVSKVMNGIGGFFKKLFPSGGAARKAAVVGAMVAGGSVFGISNCGDGCNGNHPLPYDNTVTSSTSSGTAPQPSANETAAGAPYSAPSSTAASDEPAPNVPQIDQSTAKNTTNAPTPSAKQAKVIHTQKPTVLQPQKVEPKKADTKKLPELKVCEDSTVGECIVKTEDAEKLQASLYAQLDEQKKALDKVYSPVTSGPEYVSMGVYKRDRSSIYFLEGQKPASVTTVPNPLWAQNAARKKEVDAALARARAMVSSAKTTKDFYDATDVIAKIGEQIDVLVADRGTQIAANLDVANTLNTEFAKEKMKDLETRTGKTVNAVPFGSVTSGSNGSTLTKSTIDIPMTKKLLTGSEPDMLTPTLGDDPDKVIASVQKKLEYYRGLIQLHDNLDDARVLQRPASARINDTTGNGLKSGSKTARPRLAAMAQ